MLRSGQKSRICRPRREARPGLEPLDARIVPSTIGVFDPQSAKWYLRGEVGAGSPDVAQFPYGSPGWTGVVGDWAGTGADSIGVVDRNNPAGLTWYLRNSNSPGSPSTPPFAFGAPGWIPVVGDWDGNGTTTIGAVDPATETWYLRNSNSPGHPDLVFAFGAPGWKPVVGDWDGNGTSTVGVVDPSTETWYLRNANSPGHPDYAPFAFGAPNWTPVVGDWDGNRSSTVGVVDPASEMWYLRNANAAGHPDYTPFAYGAPGWTPVAGNWTVPAPVPFATVVNTSAADPADIAPGRFPIPLYVTSTVGPADSTADSPAVAGRATRPRPGR